MEKRRRDCRHLSEAGRLQKLQALFFISSSDPTSLPNFLSASFCRLMEQGPGSAPADAPSQPDGCEESAPASPEAVEADIGLLRCSEMQARKRQPLRKWATARHIHCEAGGRQGEPDGSEQYSPESLQRRYQLRQHPDVVRALQDWWSAAQSSSVQGGGGDSSLSRDDYVRLCMRVYQAVLKNYDEDEARESAEADWEHDTRGVAELGCDPFMDALFELADLLTGHSVGAAVYVGFLTTLLHRLAVAGGEHADPAGALGWRAAEEVSYGGYVLEREQQGEEGEGAHELIGTASPAGTRAPSPPVEVFSACLPAAAGSPLPGLLPDEGGQDYEGGGFEEEDGAGRRTRRGAGGARSDRYAVRAAAVSPEGPLSPERDLSGEGCTSPAVEISPWRALKARLNGSDNRQVAFHSSAPRAVVRCGPSELSGSPLHASPPARGRAAAGRAAAGRAAAGLAVSASEPQLQRPALPPLCTRGRRSRAMPPSGEISPETSPPPQNAERTSPQRRAAEVPRCEREAAARRARTLPSLARPGGGSSIRASEREREGERLATDGRADGRALAANVYEYEEGPTVRRRTEAAAAAAERRAAHSRLTGFCAVSPALSPPLAQLPAYGRVAHRGADSEKRRRRELLRREAEEAMSLTSTVAAAPIPGGAWFRPEFARLMMMQTQAHQRLVF